jgi:uncharacterized PurR-regulated membrane protein YhhQ (DUF165 family)
MNYNKPLDIKFTWLIVGLASALIFSTLFFLAESYSIKYVVVYSLSFLFLQLINELFGKVNALKTYYVASWSTILFIAIGYFVNANVIDDTLNMLLFAGISIIISQFVNIKIYAFIKEKKRHLGLWTRALPSLIIAQIISTAIMYSYLFVNAILQAQILTNILNDIWLKLILVISHLILMYILLFFFRKKYKKYFPNFFNYKPYYQNNYKKSFSQGEQTDEKYNANDAKSTKNATRTRKDSEGNQS